MPTDRASYEIDYDKSAVPYASVQSAPFKLKSGNTSSFKLMGSSPAKIDFGGIGGGSLWDRIKTQMREARQKRAAARGVVVKTKGKGFRATRKTKRAVRKANA